MRHVTTRRLLMSAAFCFGLTLFPSAALADHTGEETEGGDPGSLSNLIGDLYGGEGLLVPGSFGEHVGHFQAASQEQLNNLNNIIAGNLGVITFGSTVGAVTFDIEQGVPVRTQESLGPLVAERASTIGAGRINLSLSYTFVDYSQLNGTSLDSLTLDLKHHDDPGENPYETDFVRLNLDLELRQHILAFAGAYGVTDNIDVAVIVPIVRTEGSVTSEAEVISTFADPLHVFAPDAVTTSSNKASATGIGDILLRAKWQAADPSNSRLGLALLTQLGLATGDEDDLLGTGSHSIYLGGVVSGSLGRINPHLNLGYEHFFSEPGNIDAERSNIRGAAGFDIKARPNLAFAADLLGRREQDGDKFYDLAIGAKWAPMPSLPLSANLVVPINRNEGLRPDFYFTLGVESTF